jgi:hypothetical protein
VIVGWSLHALLRLLTCHRFRDATDRLVRAALITGGRFGSDSVLRALLATNVRETPADASEASIPLNGSRGAEVCEDGRRSSHQDETRLGEFVYLLNVDGPAAVSSPAERYRGYAVVSLLSPPPAGAQLSLQGTSRLGGDMDSGSITRALGTAVALSAVTLFAPSALRAQSTIAGLAAMLRVRCCPASRSKRRAPC